MREPKKRIKRTSRLYFPREDSPKDRLDIITYSCRYSDPSTIGFEDNIYSDNLKPPIDKYKGRRRKTRSFIQRITED